MSAIKNLKRYLLIINLLKSKNRNFEEINARLKDHEMDISHRTFQRDIQTIENIFNVIIVFSKEHRVYKIDWKAENGIKNQLEAMDIFTAFQSGSKLNKSSISFEDRLDKGTEYLSTIIKAINGSLCIIIDYKKYREDNGRLREIFPYGLKEFEHRWYLVGKEKGSEIKVFGLDRILKLTVTESKFTRPKRFDIEEYFKYHYGIYRVSNEVEPPPIIIAFDHFHKQFQETLKLHHSQKLIGEKKNPKTGKIETHYEYKFHLNHNIIMKILSFGDGARVVSPAAVKKTIIAQLKKTLKAYQ